MSKPNDFTTDLVAQSQRVKGVDLHPREPLVLCSLYNGQVTLWNYETQSMLKAFEIVDRIPVRCCKFITPLQAFACAADDLRVRVFNYNTMEKLKSFEAHADYIRSIAVHQQLPYMLTSSDDMTIKMWDLSKNWAHVMTFEGHSHYVMACVFNPKDSSTFATASLDHSLMVWSITSPVRNFVLEGHQKGVNCVEYSSAVGQPYLVSGSDDATVKIWDYEARACLQTLPHHANYVTAVFFHPELPLLFTAGEDGMFFTLSTQTWRLEQAFNGGMNRAWSISCRGKRNRCAVGYDNGLVVLRICKEEPVTSMDSQGKVTVSQSNDSLRMDVRHGLSDQNEKGSCDVSTSMSATSGVASLQTPLLEEPVGMANNHRRYGSDARPSSSSSGAAAVGTSACDANGLSSRGGEACSSPSGFSAVWRSVGDSVATLSEKVGREVKQFLDDL